MGHSYQGGSPLSSLSAGAGMAAKPSGGFQVEAEAGGPDAALPADPTKTQHLITPPPVPGLAEDALEGLPARPCPKGQRDSCLERRGRHLRPQAPPLPQKGRRQDPWTQRHLSSPGQVSREVAEPGKPGTQPPPHRVRGTTPYQRPGGQLARHCWGSGTTAAQAAEPHSDPGSRAHTGRNSYLCRATGKGQRQLTAGGCWHHPPLARVPTGP